MYQSLCCSTPQTFQRAVWLYETTWCHQWGKKISFSEFSPSLGSTQCLNYLLHLSNKVLLFCILITLNTGTMHFCTNPGWSLTSFSVPFYCDSLLWGIQYLFVMWLKYYKYIVTKLHVEKRVADWTVHFWMFSQGTVGTFSITLVKRVGAFGSQISRYPLANVMTAC